MTITVTVPNRIRRDLQNFSDTICDALNGVWYADDCQIEELHMRKVYASDRRWSLTVAVEEYENAHLP
jgi:Holliday junction resolvase RusA-like endonuclease